MTRTEKNADMSKVSPFLIKKRIDGIAGVVMECKKLRNGSLIIKCFNKIQAEKVMKITCLTENIAVKVEIHQAFNRCKGKIFSRDLKYLTTGEILEELNTQKVIDITRIKRKDRNTGKITDEDLGLYILTFSSCNLPEKIFIGYESINVEAHIPMPFRCFKCFQFGHSAEKCTKDQKCCPNCNKVEHSKKTEEGYEKCIRTAECANCHKEHNSFSRTCELYQKEYEIQRIRVLNKISYAEAKRRFNTLNPLPSTMAQVVNSVQNPLPSTSKENVKENPLEKLNTKTVINKQGKTTTLLPRNTSKFKIEQIKKGNKSKKFKDTTDPDKKSSSMSIDDSE